MGLITRLSHCYHTLLDQWIHEVLSEQRKHGPLETRVVVPNHSVASWLQRSFARRCGVMMNIRFIYFESLMGEPFLERIGAENTHPWLLLEWASVLAGAPALEHGPRTNSILSSLDHPPSALQRLQLAWEQAQRLLQYAEHRPHWFNGWATGHMMPELEEGRQWETASAFQLLLQRKCTMPTWLDWPALEPRPPRIPGARLHVFGCWHLSPSRWDLLEQLAQVQEVDLYLPFPSAGYLVDLTRRATHTPTGVDTTATASTNLPAHNLLARLGQRARAMQMLCIDRNAQTEELFPSLPEPKHRLSFLKSLLLEPDSTPTTEALPSAHADTSMQLHGVCSPAREVEVCKAIIQRSLETNPSLTPEDIQVHAPDLQLYRPFIDATFTPEPDEPPIPFHLRESVDAEQIPAIRAITQFLMLLGSDWKRDDVMLWLRSQPVREALELDVAEVDVIAGWIQAIGIFEGNPAHSKTADWPYSWEAGMNRLLQAYGGQLPMNGYGSSGFDRDPPWEHPDLFARFISWYHFAKSACRFWQQAPAELESYRAWMRSVLEQILGESAAFEKQVLLTAVNRGVDAGSFDEVPDPSSFLYLLRRALPKLPPPQVHGRKGGVAFSSIRFEDMTPCRLRILMGMNEGVFPTSEVPQSHDLLHGVSQQPSDPSQRHDQHYWLLQSLHATDDKWVITYQNTDASGQAVRLLSPAVESILQCLKAFDLEVKPVVHPRFAYDPQCFGRESAMHHYSQVAYRMASNLDPGLDGNPPALATPGADALMFTTSVTLPTSLSIWEVAAFYSHPNRYVCQQKLGLQFPKTTDFSAEHEPLLWMPRGQRNLNLVTDLLRISATSGQPAILQPLLKQHNVHFAPPLQSIAEAWVRDDVKAIGKLPAPHTLQLLLPELLHPASTELLPGLTFDYAQLRQPLPKGMQLAAIRATSRSTRHKLEAWVQLLGLWMDAPDDERPSFLLIHRDDGIQLHPPPDPRQTLVTLVTHMLHWQHGAVPFFPATSEHFVKGNKPLDQLETSSHWDGEMGERMDPANSLFFRDRNPFDAAFEALAKAVFEPILEMEALHGKGGRA
jgi:exodeoxyribonuclease V gamma subunit